MGADFPAVASELWGPPMPRQLNPSCRTRSRAPALRASLAVVGSRERRPPQTPETGVAVASRGRQTSPAVTCIYSSIQKMDKKTNLTQIYSYAKISQSSVAHRSPRKSPVVAPCGNGGPFWALRLRLLARPFLSPFLYRVVPERESVYEATEEKCRTDHAGAARSRRSRRSRRNG